MQSSHLSAWLAHGCISPRQIWWDTLRYEQEVEANESTYWLRFELLWREYFRWYSRASDWTLFRRTGPSDTDFRFDQDTRRFEMWKTGHTGYDIVDAAMSELNQTGWMSNRARQLVASHLIYESNLDWRLGAAYFESQLIDFDVASNWGNWAYIAGVGPDPRGGRIFNLGDQADRYDPDGSYRRRWLS
jgi:deoxyribodipyrimidine photo-lyase